VCYNTRFHVQVVLQRKVSFISHVSHSSLRTAMRIQDMNMSFTLPDNNDRLTCTLHRAQCLSCLCKGRSQASICKLTSKVGAVKLATHSTQRETGRCRYHVLYSDVVNVLRTPFTGPELTSASRHVLARDEVVWSWGVRINKPEAYH